MVPGRERAILGAAPRPNNGSGGVAVMQRIPRDLARKYAFDWRDEPLLRVRPGETFEIET